MSTVVEIKKACTHASRKSVTDASQVERDGGDRSQPRNKRSYSSCDPIQNQ